MPELTFAAQRGEFVIRLDAQGVTEAKNAQTVVAPQLNWVITQVAWLPPEGTYVKKGDIVADLEASQIENKYLNARSEVEITKADAEKSMAEFTLQHANLQSQAKNTQASLDASRLQLDRMEFESPRNQEIRQLRIASDEIELDKIAKKLDSNEKIQKEERARLQLKVKQAESKLNQARHHLSQLLLKAPVDGFVQYAKLWSGGKVGKGTQLWPQMPIVKIPDLSVMQVKLQVGETDAQKLKKGQHALITIPSLDDLVLTGKVTKVDRVAKPIKKDRKTTKVKRVEVLVEIDSTEAAVAPGLTANCTIVIEKVEDALSLPRECLFDKDGVNVVYVLENSSFTPHAVAVAKYGDDFVTLHSDLNGGELCALKEPSSSRINWPEQLVAPTPPAPTDSTQTTPTPDSLKQKLLSLEKEAKTKVMLSRNPGSNP